MNENFYNYYDIINNKFSYTIINNSLDFSIIKSLESYILNIYDNGFLPFASMMAI